jgi:hypothetical protein
MRFGSPTLTGLEVFFLGGGPQGAIGAGYGAGGSVLVGFTLDTHDSWAPWNWRPGVFISGGGTVQDGDGQGGLIGATAGVCVEGGFSSNMGTFSGSGGEVGLDLKPGGIAATFSGGDPAGVSISGGPAVGIDIHAWPTHTAVWSL